MLSEFIKKYFLVGAGGFAVFYPQEGLFFPFCGYIARHALLINR